MNSCKWTITFSSIVSVDNSIIIYLLSNLRGTDNFSLIPQFFSQKSWDFYIRGTNIWTARLILLASSTWLQRYFSFSCSSHFKSQLLKMATTVMTVEFGTIHHNSTSVEEIVEAHLCSSLNRYKKPSTLCKLLHFDIEFPCFEQ